MTNSRANTGGKTEILDNHIATGTEATYTYTPTVALDLVNTYREIFVIITGQATAALALQLKINANTNYDEVAIKHDSTVLSGSQSIDLTAISLVSNGLIDGAVSFHSKTTIRFNNASDNLCGETVGGAAHEGNHHQIFEDQSTDTTITSLETKTSTSTWIAGTEITTIGIKR